MAKKGSCCRRPYPSGCHATKAIRKVQPFPTNGVLAGNMNLPLARLPSRLRRTRDRAYSYVVSSVKLNKEVSCFEQYGSALNFQGDLLTLCTCKHQMRAGQSAVAWENHVWVAGFTSRCIYERKHWLFYLMKVDTAFESHSELWSGMSSKVKKAKAARKHFLGDMFEPKKLQLTGNARNSPSRYYTPSIHAHRQHRGDTGWHNDINYRHADRYRHPPLLVGDPRLTFLWEEPIIYLKHDHYRDYSKWAALQELIAQLGEARS